MEPQGSTSAQDRRQAAADNAAFEAWLDSTEGRAWLDGEEERAGMTIWNHDGFSPEGCRYAH